MKKDWETPTIQKISYRCTEGGTYPFTVEYTMYNWKTGS